MNTQTAPGRLHPAIRRLYEEKRVLRRVRSRWTRPEDLLDEYRDVIQAEARRAAIRLMDPALDFHDHEAAILAEVWRARSRLQDAANPGGLVRHMARQAVTRMLRDTGNPDPPGDGSPRAGMERVCKACGSRTPETPIDESCPQCNAKGCLEDVRSWTSPAIRTEEAEWNEAGYRIERV